MVNQAKPPFFTSEQYLTLDTHSEYKSEYYRGEIFQMAQDYRGTSHSN
jgi:Uma2 family endonuclease